MSVLRRRPGIAVFVTFAAWPAAATCECIQMGPPCQEVARAGAVFAGTVISITETVVARPDGRSETREVVRFNVERAFVNATPGVVELSDSAFSSNAYHFAIGSQYLVYAYDTGDGKLTASDCSRTRPLAEAREDLEYLAALPQRTAGVLVSGRVTEWGRHPAEEHGADCGPLKDVVIIASGATYSRTVSTDERGRYAFQGVPPGRLTVTVVAPPGLGPEVRREFDVKSFGCLPADFVFAAEATLTGTVQDLNGRPLAGVAIDAVAEELAGFSPPAYQGTVTTDEYGAFRFERLPPGRYVFGVNLTSAYGQRPAGIPVFFPATTSVRDAAVVELAAGDRKDLGVVRVPR